MTYRRVVGVDLSLTGTGIVIIDSRCAPGLHTFGSTGKRADDLPTRSYRLRTIANHVMTHAHDADLVMLEGPAITRQGGSNWDRAGLWWLVVDNLDTRKIVVIPPTQVKSFAAGKGNADKAAVAVGMARLWGDVTAANDNEWDALALATMGAQHLGLDVPSRGHHAGVLAKVSWPDTTEEAA